MDDLRTAFLGRFGEQEADLVVEILRDAGIAAFTKLPSNEPSHTQWAMMADTGVVMVDASRVDEARALLAQELPRQLEAIARAMDDLDRSFDRRWGEPEP